MSIASYSDLKTAQQNWAARTDATFTNRQDDFIDMAEARFYWGCGEPGDSLYTPPLRVIGMETTGDLTISTQSVAQPTGFLEAIRLYMNTDPIVDLEFLPPDRFWNTTTVADGSTGQPKIYTMEGSNFVFGPSPDSSYTGKLLYYKKLSALSDSTTTNWLITNAPYAYLYAIMLEAMVWDKNYEEAAKYADLTRSAIVGLNRQRTMKQYSGAYLRGRPDKVA